MPFRHRPHPDTRRRPDEPKPVNMKVRRRFFDPLPWQMLAAISEYTRLNPFKTRFRLILRSLPTVMIQSKRLSAGQNAPLGTAGVLLSGRKERNPTLPGHAVNTPLYTRYRHLCLIRSWQRGILPSCITSNIETAPEPPGAWAKIFLMLTLLVNALICLVSLQHRLGGLLQSPICT